MKPSRSIPRRQLHMKRLQSASPERGQVDSQLSNMFTSLEVLIVNYVNEKEYQVKKAILAQIKQLVIVYRSLGDPKQKATIAQQNLFAVIDQEHVDKSQNQIQGASCLEVPTAQDTFIKVLTKRFSIFQQELNSSRKKTQCLRKNFTTNKLWLLPTELRYMIYSYVFDIQPGSYMFVYYPRHVRNLPKRLIFDIQSLHGGAIRRAITFENHLAFFRTCRVCYNDVMPFFYSETRFYFKSIELCIDFLKHIENTRRKHIQHLGFPVSASLLIFWLLESWPTTTAGPCLSTIAKLQQCMRFTQLLKKFHCLKLLALVVYPEVETNILHRQKGKELMKLGRRLNGDFDIFRALKKSTDIKIKWLWNPCEMFKKEDTSFKDRFKKK
ncbi:MAG: hypothetical protein M1834_006529 [Cirrosporium novae-zelandiae]|nr:MAG: hypothetical protein M1834_006529 [Cirrosporium novae-zelandiae]